MRFNAQLSGNIAVRSTPRRYAIPGLGQNYALAALSYSATPVPNTADPGWQLYTDEAHVDHTVFISLSRTCASAANTASPGG